MEPIPPPPTPTLRIRILRFLRRIARPLTTERRAEVQVLLRDACTPDFDFFLLVALSGVIAASGLITDSAAVIIGAMLVAPLKSPILGISLASITADTRLARDAITGLARGMLLTIAVALVLT